MHVKTRPLVPGVHRSARAWRAALLAVLGAVALGPASAGVVGVISTSVKTLSNQVTYSSVSKSGAPLVTYLGYEFKTVYDPTATNTTNNVVLQGDLMVEDPDELATLALDTESTSGACSAQTLPDRIRLTCVVGQVRAGAAPIFHTVFFKAPIKADGNGVADVDGSDVVELSGTTLYAEGSDGAGNTNNSAAWIADGDTTVKLGTVITDKIQSALPKRGGSLYSGNSGVANPDDKFATRVSVPDFSATSYRYTQAKIEETSFGCVNSPLGGGVVCLALDLTILGDDGETAVFTPLPGSEPLKPLSVKFSIDKELCPKSSCSLDQLKFRYGVTEIQQCPTPGAALGTGVPCLNGLPQRVKDPKNKDRDGDIEAETLNTQNGRISIGS